MSTSSAHASTFDPIWWQFNMLPSKTLHPSHWQAYPPGPALAAMQARPEQAEVWHRHWSRHILQSLGMWERPAPCEQTAAGWLIPYGASDLRLLARRMGAVLCAPRLRRCVSGALVRALAAAMGQDLYGLTLLGEGAPHPGLPGPAFDDPATALEQIEVLGWGALLRALENDSDAVRVRMALRLPAAVMAPEGLAAPQALALAEALDARESRV
ncbi:Yop proteins translocation protein K [Bordetella sp. LUAb4]|uniref:Yop proteins translocation protein K n=1 Tax=Bordetella sp. LUAb4 TaxID=2843195 RepID=UPI001E4F5D1C|nr:Yop proteins translocation protein K [Bordetella sp. LUAb4]